MGIVDEDVVRVREVTDMVAVVSEYTQLKRVGLRYQGLCPFHAEKTGSFSVNAEDGLYYCFGCGVGGDIITFVQEKEQLDFVAAVEMLANKANVTLRYTTSGQGEVRRRKAILQETIGKAVEWYHQRLLTSADAGPARSYLRQRGYDGDVVRRYRIGWAPEGWDLLAKALRVSDEDLTDSGLGFVNRFGRQQDAFRGRIQFPIFDAQGEAVGFGGRIMPGHDGPKYKNSSESTVYAKSRVLYGLHWAKTAIVEADEVIVCEGYTDVIGFDLAGAGRAVATCGTALTEEHVKLLRRFARRVVLAFDADAAGQNAAARFYEWEKAHDLDVAVVDMGAGVDPADLAQSDPARLVQVVTEARPFLEFRVDRAIDGVDRSTAEGRAKAAERAMAMVAEHPDRLVRDQYVMMVASRCQFEPDLIRSMLAEGAQPRQAQRPSERPQAASNRNTAELEALRLAVHKGQEVMDLLVPDLFVEPRCATVYDLFCKFSSLHDVIEHGGPEVAEFVQRLAVEESTADALDVAALLWRGYLGRQMDEYRAKAREATGEASALLAKDFEWFRLQLEQLQDPAQKASTVESLLGWVLEDLEEDS
ncbi:MAG: DNA primase [Actinomycetia bacterium]|nr:DNA primase [Actinomycetes bacterium]